MIRAHMMGNKNKSGHRKPQQTLYEEYFVNYSKHPEVLEWMVENKQELIGGSSGDSYEVFTVQLDDHLARRHAARHSVSGDIEEPIASSSEKPDEEFSADPTDEGTDEDQE